MLKGYLFWFIFLVPSLGFADTTLQGVYASCWEGKQVKVSAYNIVSGSPKLGGKFMYSDLTEEEKRNVFRGYDKQKIECHVAGKSVVIEFQLTEPRARGMCGANPGGKITMFYDGKLIFRNATFNNDCYDALDSVELTDFGRKRSRFAFKLCGHSSNRKTSVDGCVEFSKDQFLSIPTPISGSPMRKLVLNRLQ